MSNCEKCKYFQGYYHHNCDFHPKGFDGNCPDYKWNIMTVVPTMMVSIIMIPNFLMFIGGVYNILIVLNNSQTQIHQVQVKEND